MADKNGVAGFHDTFDALNRSVESHYFGVDGKPAMRKDAAATWKYEYDKWGNMTSIALFGLNGEPIALKGLWKLVDVFDEFGNKVEETLYGVDGNLVIGAGGFAIDRVKLDAYGNVIEEEFFDADGKPTIATKLGYAKIVSAYFDQQGRAIPTEVMVTEIIPDTTAARIGLAPGDRFLSYDGIKITSREQMIALTGAGGGGMRVLVIRRGSEVASIEIPAGRIGAYLETVRAESKAKAPNQ
jgi:YD repeat-containing protein